MEEEDPMGKRRNRRRRDPTYSILGSKLGHILGVVKKEGAKASTSSIPSTSSCT